VHIGKRQPLDRLHGALNETDGSNGEIASGLGGRFGGGQGASVKHDAAWKRAVERPIGRAVTERSLDVSDHRCRRHATPTTRRRTEQSRKREREPLKKELSRARFCFFGSQKRGKRMIREHDQAPEFLSEFFSEFLSNFLFRILPDCLSGGYLGFRSSRGWLRGRLGFRARG
jgi:hypothetical protein